MNQSERSNLINGLKDAMEKKETAEDTRLVFDSVSIERHNYARLVDIKDVKTEEQLYLKYPDSFSVKALIKALGESNETIVKNAANDVRSKFLIAADAGDDEKVAEIIKTASDLNERIGSASNDSNKKALIYMIVADTIKKL